MKVLGLYEELWPIRAGTPTGRLKGAARDIPDPNENETLNYLMNSHDLLSVMGAEEDVLGSDHRILGGHSIKTDGEWIWRDSLWFYVSRYHISLPDEFTEKVRAYNYEVPFVPESLLDELATKATEIW